METLDQLFTGTFDFMMYTKNDEKLANAVKLTQKYNLGNVRKEIKDMDALSIYKRLSKDIIGIEVQDGTYPVVGSGHSIGGYPSAYYGYMWSRVYADDLFTKF